MRLSVADKQYQNLLDMCRNLGDRVITRNHAAFSIIDAQVIYFNETPLVTFKKTAWPKAIGELGWFLSGDPECPKELWDWWKDQLCEERNEDGTLSYYYYRGYGEQLRNYGGTYDQLAAIIKGIQEHPISRRQLMTTWHPEDMARITEINNNPLTPATCHGTSIQVFVRNGRVHLVVDQRSADIVLGVPHNWIQYWAFLLWLAHKTHLEVGSLQWRFGDLHLYDEPSHLAVADAIIQNETHKSGTVELVYRGDGGDFRAEDFEMVGTIPEPVTTTRAKLL